MSCSRLYSPDLSVGINTLCAAESHHAVASLRAKKGMKVVLFDGAGREADGIITQADRRAMMVEVREIAEYPFELSWRLTLAVAMPKMHRQGYLIEKCTELGAAAIWPIVTHRSVVKPSSAAVEKWSQRAIEAAKQSKRRWVPVIKSPCSFDECMKNSSQYDSFVMLDIEFSGDPFHEILKNTATNSKILVVIGPEGGWVDQERQQAIQAGAICTSIAPTVLRTETAAVAVCAIAAAVNDYDD